MDKRRDSRDIEKEVNQLRKEQAEKLKKLNDFEREYNTDKLLEDLQEYFGKEVDFNFDKIKEEVQEQDILKDLIDRAVKNETHPVIEFIRYTLQDL
ncbi:MAG: hypothetical protein K9L95_01525 [Candidatus Omnitrophica bacterium]|nr:hypothetical protein [Candidatus Omnitrophota bacterium]MCF7877621.1 hypothetical protein [Candidatus Omnitrophota bacterium]MCF7878135.1 hypothetical protein [Candidatus Omnitrophota bacterium]MCF7893308.1 hypothetical protein [Candidatus Omnitrophota bacterium]